MTYFIITYSMLFIVICNDLITIYISNHPLIGNYFVSCLIKYNYKGILKSMPFRNEKIKLIKKQTYTHTTIYDTYMIM